LPDEIRVVLDEVIDSPTKRVHDKKIGVAPRVQRVERDTHGVVAGEAAVAVLGGGPDQVRLTVMGINGDVEIFRIIEEPQFGALGHRLTGIGFELIEFVDELGLRPHRVRYVAIDDRSLRGFDASGSGGRHVGVEVLHRSGNRAGRRRRFRVESRAEQRARRAGRRLGWHRSLSTPGAPGEEKQTSCRDARLEHDGPRCRFSEGSDPGFSKPFPLEFPPA
jgi:hypothetical protein